jgi:DNA-binding response OmpR family regulator
MHNKTILIADDDRLLVQGLAVRCSQMGLQVRRAYDASEALEMIEADPPDVACIDLELPRGNGFGLVEMIQGDERHSALPIVVLTGDKDEQTITRCERLGVHYVPKSADLSNRIMPLLRSLTTLTDHSPAMTASVRSAIVPESTITHDAGPPLSSPNDRHGLIDAVFAALGVSQRPLETPPHDPRQDAAADVPWVLTIDDDPDFTYALKKRLEVYGVAVARAYDGTDGYRTAFSQPASLITLDYEMPNGKGDYVLGRLKDNPVTHNIPVIVLTGKHDRALERKMINLGATRYLTKPLVFEELLTELRKHIDVLPAAVAV